MKQSIKKTDQYIILFYVFCWLAFFNGLLFPPKVIGEKSVADEIISLDVKNEPLGEVLEETEAGSGDVTDAENEILEPTTNEDEP